MTTNKEELADLKSRIISLEAEVMALLSIVGTIVRHLPDERLQELREESWNTNYLLGIPTHRVPPAHESGLLADRFIEWLCSRQAAKHL
jgi:hypothetical protein